MKNIVLIGFMGSGKSTLAKQLAHTLHFAFIDSDEYIAQQEKRSIRNIFAQDGETYFRSLECEFIKTFSAKQNYILATGGGMPIFNDVKKLGTIFYLQSDFDTITQRIQTLPNTARPLFDDIYKAKLLYTQRQAFYESQSDFIINANQTIQESLCDILKILQHICEEIPNAKN